MVVCKCRECGYEPKSKYVYTNWGEFCCLDCANKYAEDEEGYTKFAEIKDIIHITPSGGDKSLCGMVGVKGNSLGLCCTCKECYDICQDVINKQVEKENERK